MYWNLIQKSFGKLNSLHRSSFPWAKVIIFWNFFVLFHHFLFQFVTKKICCWWTGIEPGWAPKKVDFEWEPILSSILKLILHTSSNILSRCLDSACWSRWPSPCSGSAAPCRGSSGQRSLECWRTDTRVPNLRPWSLCTFHRRSRSWRSTCCNCQQNNAKRRKLEFISILRFSREWKVGTA